MSPSCWEITKWIIFPNAVIVTKSTWTNNVSMLRHRRVLSNDTLRRHHLLLLDTMRLTKRYLHRSMVSTPDRVDKRPWWYLFCWLLREYHHFFTWLGEILTPIHHLGRVAFATCRREVPFNHWLHLGSLPSMWSCIVPSEGISSWVQRTVDHVWVDYICGTCPCCSAS